MAPTTLAPGFSLRQARPDEMKEVFNVCLLAIYEDPLYRLSIGTCKHDAVLNWFLDILGPRWMFPDVSTWVIVEDGTG
jgi:hypothetical protein